MIDINKEIDKLLDYGIEKGMISRWDRDLCRNDILDILDLDEYTIANKRNKKVPDYPVDILNNILDWAVENNRVEDSVVYRDILDSRLIATMMPKQGVLIDKFQRDYTESPQLATQNYYNLSKYSNYIRTSRIDKNLHWYSDTDYGKLEITINLSKPEKDPKAIAAAKEMKESSYPKCLLCKENVGYRGRVNHPARKNHRIIPLDLGGKEWNLQYSPYVYYNEHAIIFSSEHSPMKISKESLEKLLEFIEIFPHYFVGSNADLPIVGGSILSHDHFQGGNHEFPMAKAAIEKDIFFDNYPDIKAGIVKWPLSVIRLQAKDRHKLLDLAADILTTWKGYSDESIHILASTNQTPHNTITPIARRRGDLFELDLVLRNNRTNEDFPMGIFHPYEEFHNIKKENIGLIEVMGLAVLPGRLKEELTLIKGYLIRDSIEEIKGDQRIKHHYEWVRSIEDKLGLDKEEGLRVEVAKVFGRVLECCGVFKRDDSGQKSFLKFINKVSK